MAEATRKVAVIIGATSKWQADGKSTAMVTGGRVSDDALPLGIRWGIGGALAQSFADAGYHIVLTTRKKENASTLSKAIASTGGSVEIVELDLGDHGSVKAAFAEIRNNAGDPEVVIYNAGYSDGRELPPELELLENLPEQIFETAMQISARAPFWVAKEVLPAMRRAGRGSFFLTNNQYSLHGRKRKTGESLYYPRVLMRTLAQVLTEEYSEYGVHIANVIIDGMIDSPGTRAYGEGVYKNKREALLDPVKIAEAYLYLHHQDPSCWSHEMHLTPYNRPVSR